MTAAAMTRPSPATVLSAGERARTAAEALLGLADDAGGVEVSQAALAAAAGMDRRTLGRAMGRLEDAGLVSVEEAATPNSPAVYDVGRLVEAAAAEGLVPRRPAGAGAPAGGPAQPAPVVRRLSHEEAVDPAGHVVEGGRYLVDPEDLQRGDNIRRDLRVGADFLETVRAHGVVKDIDVYVALTGLVVLDGHRRHHAAVALGLDVVPVRVVQMDTEVERIARQLMVNDEHAHTNAAERADAITQLVLLGAPARDLRRRGVRSEEIKAARAVAEAPADVRRVAVERPGIDLVGMGLLAGLAEQAVPGSKYLARAVEQVRERPEQLEHIVSRERDRVAMERLLVERTRELQSQGCQVIDDTGVDNDVPPGWRKASRRLEDLVDERGEEITPEGHASCPGHCATLRLVTEWDPDAHAYRPSRVDVSFWCSDWAAHGHRNRHAQPSSGATSGPQDEETRRARRELIAHNKGWDAANEVRRRWLRESLLARPRPPADADLWAAPIQMGSLSWLSNGATIARGWERLERSPADYALPRTPARARMSVVAWTCALIEASIGRTTWRDATATALRLIRLHLRSLEAWGYVLADVETDLCEAVEEDADAGDLHTVPTASAGKGAAA